MEADTSLRSESLGKPKMNITAQDIPHATFRSASPQILKQRSPLNNSVHLLTRYSILLLTRVQHHTIMSIGAQIRRLVELIWQVQQ